MQRLSSVPSCRIMTPKLFLFILLASVVIGPANVFAGDGTKKDTKPTKKSKELNPAYNAEWGKGRGFEVGQTLPDIPLYDLNGKEVRFSKFLGKQCIVYAWASW